MMEDTSCPTSDSAPALLPELTPFYNLPGYSEASPLDLADNCDQPVFQDVNYKVTPTWKGYLDESAVVVSGALRAQIVSDALAGDNQVPQREFVGRMVTAAQRVLPKKHVQSLEKVALDHGAPKECGLVAMVIVLKEQAKADMIRIAPVTPEETNNQVVTRLP